MSLVVYSGNVTARNILSALLRFCVRDESCSYSLLHIILHSHEPYESSVRIVTILAFLERLSIRVISLSVSKEV